MLGVNTFKSKNPFTEKALLPNNNLEKNLIE